MPLILVGSQGDWYFQQSLGERGVHPGLVASTYVQFGIYTDIFILSRAVNS